MGEKNVNAVFETLRETFTQQQTIRDSLRDRREEAETFIRAAQHALVALHTADDLRNACKPICAHLLQCGPAILRIEAVLPDQPGAFFRYSDSWLQTRQNVVMVCVMLAFITEDRLADVQHVCQLIGGEIRLPLEDFLIGVCNAVSDLVRLSMNRVIKKDYETPKRCALFATWVFDSFKELNFRNDFLRKRYDGVKYDVKRLEEIVYDLSIRGLLTVPAPSPEADGGSDGDAVASTEAAVDKPAQEGTNEGQASMEVGE